MEVLGKGSEGCLGSTPFRSKGRCGGGVREGVVGGVGQEHTELLVPPPLGPSVGKPHLSGTREEVTRRPRLYLATYTQLIKTSPTSAACSATYAYSYLTSPPTPLSHLYRHHHDHLHPTCNMGSVTVTHCHILCHASHHSHHHLGTADTSPSLHLH